MGDLCDMNDVDRFMQATKGQEHLDAIVRMLKGKTITGVTFSNEVYAVMTILHLSDGSTMRVLQPDHEVEAGGGGNRTRSRRIRAAHLRHLSPTSYGL